MKGMMENAYKCKHTGGIPPLGFDIDPETKQYLCNVKEAETIRLIFCMYLDGQGYPTTLRLH
jgi:site-specific DNA recombinase